MPVDLQESYRELGLDEQASDAELKAAWRRLAARWHPDRNPSPQALKRIQRINRALEEIRRARESGAAPAAGPETIEHGIELQLEEAARGCTREVEGLVLRPCTACAGTGFAEPATCGACAGEGSIRPPLWFGWLAASHPCGSCGGRGRTAVTCPGCRGQASARCRYHGRVRIPAGVRDGQELRAWVQVEGHGRQALALRVALQPHPLFGLDDDGTVQVEVPVDGFDWIGERWIEVPTLQGVKEMRLQRGAQTYRIREAGFPGGVGGTPADCVVRVVPLFPSAWTRQQEALLDQLVATNTGDAKTEPGARTAAWKRRAGVGR